MSCGRLHPVQLWGCVYGVEALSLLHPFACASEGRAIACKQLRCKGKWPSPENMRLASSNHGILINASDKMRRRINLYASVGFMQLCAIQANTKWFEGAANQSIYWSISDDGGLTWGPTRVLLPSPDTLPIWGPVQHAEVSTSASAACSDL